PSKSSTSERSLRQEPLQAGEHSAGLDRVRHFGLPGQSPVAEDRPRIIDEERLRGRLANELGDAYARHTDARRALAGAVRVGGDDVHEPLAQPGRGGALSGRAEAASEAR